MSTAPLDHLDPQQLRALAERLLGEAAARDEKLVSLDAQLLTRNAQLAKQDAQIAAYDAQIAKRDQVLHVKQTHIDQLIQELALYKRWRYGKRSEQLNSAQASLLEETMDADMAAIEEEVNALRAAIARGPTRHRNAASPSGLRRQ